MQLDAFGAILGRSTTVSLNQEGIPDSKVHELSHSRPGHSAAWVICPVHLSDHSTRLMAVCLSMSTILMRFIGRNLVACSLFLHSCVITFRIIVTVRFLHRPRTASCWDLRWLRVVSNVNFFLYEMQIRSLVWWVHEGSLHTAFVQKFPVSTIDACFL